MEYEIIDLRNKKELIDLASKWFSTKRGIPFNEYKNSILESFNKRIVPTWVIALKNNEIIAGIGLIENDFHPLKELTPNICALYVERKYRNQGIAGKLLKYMVDLAFSNGINSLYLITEHDSFYEKYGFKFLRKVYPDDPNHKDRVYFIKK